MQGIALAVGLASTKHFQEVWALLEHLGRTKFLRSTFMSEDSQVGSMSNRAALDRQSASLCMPIGDTRPLAFP